MNPPWRGTVVHVVNHLAPGGIETLVLDLMRCRAFDGRQVVFSLEGTRQELIDRWPALRPLEEDLFGFAAPSGRRLRIVPQIRARLREVGAGSVFLHHIGPLLYGGLAARLAGVQNRIHVEHDVWHYDRSPGDVRILQWCERLIRPHHFAVSRPIGDRLRELLGAASIELVPPGIDTGTFRAGGREAARELLGLQPETTVVGSVGRLSDVKGHRVLVEALGLLGGDVVVVIAGEGPERLAIEQQARQLGLAERVRLLGHRDDTRLIYPAFDVFCLPSFDEGLPRVVLEAQASGVPVVASDVGGVRDAIMPGGGRLVEAGDAATLAVALAAMLEQRPDAAALHKFVAVQFNFSAIARAYAGAANADFKTMDVSSRWAVR